MTPRPGDILLTLRVKGGAAPWRDVRRFLKRLARAYGLKCVDISPVKRITMAGAVPADGRRQEGQKESK